MTEKEVAEIEERITYWSQEVNRQRRVDAMKLLAEVKRLQEKLMRYGKALHLFREGASFCAEAVLNEGHCLHDSNKGTAER